MGEELGDVALVVVVLWEQPVEGAVGALDEPVEM